MRKRTVKYLADTIFWYLVYFLPVACFLIFLATGKDNINFSSFFNELGFEFVSSNVIYDSLSSLFGVGGVLPIFTDSTPFIIFTWFIGTFLIHLAVDFLLFIPRLAHKYMNTFTQGD